MQRGRGWCDGRSEREEQRRKRSKKRRLGSLPWGEDMSKAQVLRAQVRQRLAAAAEEIFGLFEAVIAEYREETERHSQRSRSCQEEEDQARAEQQKPGAGRCLSLLLEKLRFMKLKLFCLHVKRSLRKKKNTRKSDWILSETANKNQSFLSIPDMFVRFQNKSFKVR